MRKDKITLVFAGLLLLLPQLGKALTFDEIVAFQTSGLVLGSGQTNTFLIHGEPTELSGTANGSTITPAVGPAGTLTVAGSGSVNFEPVQVSQGVYFLNGGQQQNNTAFYKFTGAQVGNVFNQSGGELDFYLKSAHSFAARKAISGNNSRYVFDALDGTNHLYSFYTQTSTQYLYFYFQTGANTTQYYGVPVGQEDSLFGQGVILKVRLVWDGGKNYLYLNDNLVSTHSYTASSPNWGSGSIMSVGSQASYGGGYFASDDAVDEFSVYANTGEPTISSFSANPSTITSGQSSTLSWVVSNATSLSIDNGVGAVSGSSVSVSPAATTTYTLTATNSSGSTTSQVTVTVSGGGSPPVISNIQASAVSSNAATITWTTDTSSDSQVDYGLSNSYGSSSALSPGLVTSHSIGLSGLSSATIYHFRVKSRDINGSLSVSTDNTFTTSSGGGSVPSISSFIASPTTISPGQSSILSWVVSNATSLSIDNGVGAVSGSSVSVSPAATTTYTLTATNSSGSTTAEVTVVVSGGSASALPNAVTIYNTAGVAITNQPTSISRIFAQGEISNYPRPSIGGAVLAQWQSNIDTRWPDGSVKHAMIFFAASISAGGSLAVSFVNDNNPCYLGNQTSCDTAAPSQAQILNFNSGNWNAQISTANSGATQSAADAKTMISNGDYRFFIKGPLANVIIAEDRNPTLKYDFGWSCTSNCATFNGPYLRLYWDYTGSTWVTDNTYKSLHPIYVLTQFTGFSGLKEEFVLDNDWITKQQDQKYDLTLVNGPGLSTTQFTKTGMVQVFNTRWRKTFWDGSAPASTLIDYNLAYLVSSKAIPNYDTTKIMSQTAVNNRVNSWNSHDKADIASANASYSGGVTKGFGSTGGRLDIGPIPGYFLDYLYTMGNPTGYGIGNVQTLYQELIGNGEVSGYTLNHNRESDPARYYDSAHTVSAFGRPVSADARPGFVSRDPVNSQGFGLPADEAKNVNGVSSNNWDSFNIAHQPDLTYVPYLLTGDWYFLEENQFWSAFNLTASTAGTSNDGRHNDWAYMNDGLTELRGVAWSLRELANAIFISPDGSPEKSYFTEKLNNNIAVREGIMGLTSGLFYDPSPGSKWSWGKKTIANNLDDPLGWAIRVNEYPNRVPFTEYVDASKSCYAAPPWQQNFNIFEYGRLAEMGFTQIEAIRESASRTLIHMVLDPIFTPRDRLAGYYIGIGNNPGSCASATAFNSWADVAGSVTAEEAAGSDTRWAAGASDTTGGYPTIALAASSFLSGLNDSGLSGSDVWTWLKANVANQSGLNDNPLWAVVPRSGSSGNGSSDTSPPTVPTALAASAVSSSQINLTWNPSTDNVGVTGYKIYRNGSQVGTSGSNGYSDTGLTSGTTYSYTVSAYDAAANNSAQSASASATTLSALPVISGLIASGLTSSSVIISWNTNVLTNAQIFYGPNSSYGLQSALVDQSPMTLAHNITLTSLAANTLYHFKATSVDGSGNSVSSSDFVFTTLPVAAIPAPVISEFSASPSTLSSGSTAVLSWTVTGTTTLLTLDQGIGSVMGSSSKTVSPTLTTTYTLTAANSGGTSTAQTIISVVAPGSSSGGGGNSGNVAPLILGFSSNPSMLTAGSSTVLSWNVTGSPSPTININGIGDVTGLALKIVSPATTTTYTLTASNLAGTATNQTTVVVSNPIIFIPISTSTPSGISSYNSEQNHSTRLINSSGTYYLITNGIRHGITNPGVLYTYGLALNQAKLATADDLALPEGSLLLPQDGALVKSKQDQTVYLVSLGKRFAFTSTKVFLALGFKFSSVFVVTNPELQALPKAGSLLSNSKDAHLPGTEFSINKTIYWIGYDGQIHPYPSLDVYNSWHLKNNFTTVVPANTADKTLPVGDSVVGRVIE